MFSKFTLAISLPETLREVPRAILSGTPQGISPRGDHQETLPGDPSSKVSWNSLRNFSWYFSSDFSLSSLSVCVWSSLNEFLLAFSKKLILEKYSIKCPGFTLEISPTVF